MASSTSDRRKYTIVGIDPGTTVGVAMLDLNGNPIDVFSAKNYSVSDMIRLIISRGKPLVVASDVTPTPSMVEKVSTIFSSHVHELNNCLTIEEKRSLTKGAGYAYKNVHERDALAACVNAFRRYKKKFSQVQKKTPPGVDVEEVKALVIKGVSITAAINRLISESAKEEDTGDERDKKVKGDEAGDKATTAERIRLRVRIAGKSELIRAMKESLLASNAQLAEKELEIEQLHAKLEFIKSARRRELEEAEGIRERDSEIKRLREELRDMEEENAKLKRVIEELKGLRAVKKGRRIKVIHAFNRDAILEIDQKYGFKNGDIVLLEDGSGGGAATAELLANKGVAAVIYGKEMSHFATQKFMEYGIPAFSTDEIPLFSQAWTDFAFVDPHLLNEKLTEWRMEKKGRKGKGKRIMFQSGFNLIVSK
ncbi:MAG: DUF460 domain-containing protein [Halobacteriota archaeon]